MSRSIRDVLQSGGNLLSMTLIKDYVGRLDEMFSYFLKRPKLFKDIYSKLPKYKRKAIIELLNETEEAG